MAKQLDPALGDYVSQEKFAEMVDRTARTVTRWRLQNGLPYLELGHSVYVSISGAREWLTNRVRNRAASRPRRRR
jgi:hypothetical protein